MKIIYVGFSSDGILKITINKITNVYHETWKTLVRSSYGTELALHEDIILDGKAGTGAGPALARAAGPGYKG